MSKEAQAQEQQLIELGLDVVETARQLGANLRLLRAVAFRVHCPRFKHLEYQVGRFLPGLDFAAYARAKIEKAFAQHGFVEDKRIKALHGTERRVFNHTSGCHADVFVDRLRFCHDVNFAGRLERDYPTIPLASIDRPRLQRRLGLLEDRNHEPGSNGRTRPQPEGWTSPRKTAGTCSIRIALLRDLIEREPESIRWRLRAMFGTRIPWYTEVEQLSRQ